MAYEPWNFSGFSGAYSPSTKKGRIFVCVNNDLDAARKGVTQVFDTHERMCWQEETDPGLGEDFGIEAHVVLNELIIYAVTDDFKEWMRKVVTLVITYAFTFSSPEFELMSHEKKYVKGQNAVRAVDFSAHPDVTEVDSNGFPARIYKDNGVWCASFQVGSVPTDIDMYRDFGLDPGDDNYHINSYDYGDQRPFLPSGLDPNPDPSPHQKDRCFFWTFDSVMEELHKMTAQALRMGCRPLVVKEEEDTRLPATPSGEGGGASRHTEC